MFDWLKESWQKLKDSITAFPVLASAVICLALSASLAFAQDVVQTPIAIDQAISQIVSIAMTFKGASPLAIAVGVGQIITILLFTSIFDKLLPNKVKWIVSTSVQFIVAIITLKISDMASSWMSVLLSSAGLTIIQGFVYNMWKNLFTAKADK